jgi:maspardin
VDEVAIPSTLRNEVYKFYPEAKVAEMKSGGNFPYVSRHEEFNLLLEVHLRNHSQLDTEIEETEPDNNVNK